MKIQRKLTMFFLIFTLSILGTILVNAAQTDMSEYQEALNLLGQEYGKEWTLTTDPIGLERTAQLTVDEFIEEFRQTYESVMHLDEGPPQTTFHQPQDDNVQVFNIPQDQILDFIAPYNDGFFNKYQTQDISNGTVFLNTWAYYNTGLYNTIRSYGTINYYDRIHFRVNSSGNSHSITNGGSQVNLTLYGSLFDGNGYDLLVYKTVYVTFYA